MDQLGSMGNDMKRRRGLSKEFINVLKHGFLKPLLDSVQCDYVLDCQIRENYVNIYYRGGNLLRIEESKSGFIATFDRKYLKEQTTKVRNLPKILKGNEEVQTWLNTIPHLKHEMDLWFGKKPKNEREFQQLVVRENNYSNIANSTDYFIIDIEYDNRKGVSSQKGARFDLIAVRWESDPICRKLQNNYRPVLSLIEMKYYDSSLDDNAGICAHLQDFQNFFSNNANSEALKSEMLGVLQQKRELGLIPGLKGKANVLKRFGSEIEVIILLANHDPASKRLLKSITETQNLFKQQRFSFTLKFCTSNFMGYGLYKQNIYNLRAFQERFEKQIYES